ncbi:MAG: T9SS type A sorting domain-containing protein [Cyclobacteriaceae bacterium]
MKKFTLLAALLLFAVCSFAQKITRGPDVGEIYFLGPTTTLLQGGIYRSTDFGNSASCMDSISQLSNNIVSITADKEVGGLYFVTMGEALFYSGNYGQYGSWEFKHSGINKYINAGRIVGEVYKSFISHSENYGLNFTSHNCNGYFGTLKDVDIDFSNDIGYCISKKYNENDTLYFFNSFNNFDDLEIIKKFNFHGLDYIDISRENNEGNIFLCNQNSKKILFSSNYGIDWELKNQLTCPNLPIVGITGGRQDGELYLHVVYTQLMGQRRHVYIYHSLDYGETFTVYHPVSIGPDPIYANFIAEDTLVEPGDTVQFTDLSNDAETWEWDFDNDGTIDSYEENPTYIYQDTGFYTVKLSITGAAIQDYGIRHDYIHVDNITDIKQNSIHDPDFLVFPIPVNEVLNIRLNFETTEIQILDFTGRLVKSFNSLYSHNLLIQVPVNDIPSGVYLLKVNSPKNEVTKKILINK